MLTDGVDFELSEVEPRARRPQGPGGQPERPGGHGRAAAGGGDCPGPAARTERLRWPKELYEGLMPWPRSIDVAIAGGDTNSWDGPLVVSVTLVGEVTAPGPLPRSGARPGDAIVVTGKFGGSILGHHFDFEPRVDEAIWLNERYELHAGIDVSDGLSLDLSRLAAESGCGAVVELRPRADRAGGRIAGAQPRRRLDAARPCPGRWRGFRVDSGRAAGRGHGRLWPQQPLDLRLDGDRPVRARSRTVADAMRRSRVDRLTPRGYEH